MVVWFVTESKPQGNCCFKRVTSLFFWNHFLQMKAEKRYFQVRISFQVKLKSCVAVEVLVTVWVNILVLFRFYKSNVVRHWNKLNCKERCLSFLFLGDEIMNCFDVIHIRLRWRQSIERRRTFFLCMSDFWLRRAAHFRLQSNMWRRTICFMNETKIMSSLLEQSRHDLSRCSFLN
jgi:hypothetical protein